MNRQRRLVVALGLGVLATAASHAQPVGRVRRIGTLSLGESGQAQHGQRIFRELLLHAGYEEGRNLVVERRYAEGKVERLAGLAQELVQLGVELIVAVGNDPVAAARQATRTIPIVMHMAVVPAELGFVASLARPGGNVTGTMWMSLETSNKVIQLLKEAVPSTARVAILFDPEAPGAGLFRAENRRAASALAMALHLFEARRPADVAPALERIAASRCDAMYVVLDPVIATRYDDIAGFALQHKLLSIGTTHFYANAGGALSYGPDAADIPARTVSFVDRILKGAKPAELPVEQPSKFYLVVNMKTTQALGITIPQSLLLRADEVIR